MKKTKNLTKPPQKIYLWVRSGLWKNIEILREISRTGGPFPGTRNFEKNRDIFP